MLKTYKWFLVCSLTALLFASCATDKAQRKEQAAASRRLGEGYLREGNPTAALKALLDAEKLYDKDPFLHYDLGLAYFYKGEPRLAISHLEKAVALKPDYAEAYNAMGGIYGGLEEWDKAISCFNKARDNLLYPTPHIVLSNLGEAYRGKMDYDRAIEAYNEAIKLDPQFPDAHRGLGLTYMDIGDYKNAVASLEKAVQFAPRFALAYFDLGRAYARLYQSDKAVDAFENVLKLVPDTALAEKASAEIKRLRP